MRKRARIVASLWLALCVIGALARTGFLISAACAQMPPEEGVTVRALPPAGPHWVYVMSPFSGTLLVTAVTAVDADSMQVMGSLTGGMASNFAASPDSNHLYMADTYYSRGARGDRTDVLTIYDSRRLEPIGEVAIPPKREITVPDSGAMALTPDGRLALISNLTPATSVSVVDLASRKFVNEIETPGCAEIIVSAPRRFSSVCGDGSMVTVDFDDNGKPTARNRTAKPFFDPEKDPVFGVPARIGNEAFFLSYGGVIYPVDLSTTPPAPEPSWPLLTDADTAARWRPGGWQPLADYASGKLLFVLMHQGGAWTHKKAGTEVWIFDTAQHKRVDRMPLPIPADSILVSQDNDPILAAVSSDQSAMQVFSALHGKYLGTMKNLSGTPLELFAP